MKLRVFACLLISPEWEHKIWPIYSIKARSATDKPNTSKCKDDSHEVSSSTSNGQANKSLEVPPPPVQVEDAAATRIQAAFRAYRVHIYEHQAINSCPI